MASKEYYQANRERYAQYAIDRRARLGNEMRAYSREYNKSESGRKSSRKYKQSDKGKEASKRYNNSPERKAYMRAYNAKHKARKRAQTAAWAKAHPEWANSRASRYRAMKRGQATGDRKLIEKVYARAAELRQWFDVAVDHIVPIARGGAHHQDNLQILYRTENARKSASMNYNPTIIFI